MAHRAFVAFLVFVVLLVTVPSGRAQEPFPVPVYVTHLETPPLPPLRREAHEAAISQTSAEMVKVAEHLRKQHDDKTNNWPRKYGRFYVAEDANTLAVARRDYQPPETRLGLADSVEDFLRGAGGNKGMTMVTTADEASLVVQITGRRRISAPGPTDNRYFIRFRVTPGAKMSPERFHELMYGYKWNSPWAKLIAHSRDTSPYVDLEAGSPASWKNGAGMVRGLWPRSSRNEWIQPGRRSKRAEPDPGQRGRSSALGRSNAAAASRRRKATSPPQPVTVSRYWI